MNIRIQDKEIQYEIIRKNVKNVTLRINKDGSILITANKRISLKRIEEFIIEKKDWIFKTCNGMESRINLSDIDNDILVDKKIMLLGQRISIVMKESIVEEVKLIEDKLFVYSKEHLNSDVLNQLLNQWISNYTKEVIVSILDEMYEKFIPYNIPYPKLRLRKMKTRWGTCSIHSNTITINTLLIHTDRECIEYVIAHELAHFLHGNHSPDFYHSLSLVMPEHESKRNMLKDYLI